MASRSAVTYQEEIQRTKRIHHQGRKPKEDEETDLRREQHHSLLSEANAAASQRAAPNPLI
jgi:hypothetical protein